MEDETSTEMATGQRRRDRHRLHVVSAVLSLVLLRDTQRACMWAMFAIVCSVQNRHRAELDRLRIEAHVTRELIGAIVTEQARAVKRVEIWIDNVNALHLKIDRVEGAMLKGKGN